MLRSSAALAALVVAGVSSVGLAGSAVRAQIDPVVSQGNFSDRAGVSHPWLINGAHTLIWDNKPFVPVGGLFQAKSWSHKPTQADYDSDVAALQLLKSRGITDIYVQPVRVGLTDVPPQAVQKLVDYLDSEGFTYGISINDGPHDILLGYQILPGAFRQEVSSDGGILRFPIESVASALYFWTTADGSEIIESGQAKMVAEGAKVTVPPINGSESSKSVVFLLPQKVSFGQTNGGLPLPNLWDGFDEYRDELIGLFAQVKLGKGFRFFIDPLPQNLALNSETDRFIPTSVNWAQEWESYLAFRYKTVAALQNSWAVTARDLKTFDEASLLLPLWSGGKGTSVLYDKETGAAHRVDTSRSAFWKDLSAFREISVRGYMNDLAVSLKKAVADVPVVYRSSGDSPLLTNLPRTRGFDGIGISAYGNGSDLITRSAGYSYAQAAEAPKTTWLMVAATADTAPSSDAPDGLPVKSAPGFVSQAALTNNLDRLREIGARGFYVDGLRLADPARKAYDMAQTPEQLDWLSAYQNIIIASGVGAAQTAPQAIFYPKNLNLPAASPRLLSYGGWWLPTSRPGTFYDFGEAGRAYALPETNGSITYYLWNPNGERRIKIKIPRASRTEGVPQVRWSQSANGEVKGDMLSLSIDRDPIRIENLATIPVPDDAFELAQGEVKTLVTAMKKRGIVDAGRFQSEADVVASRNSVSRDTPWYGLGAMQDLLRRMRTVLRPYAWIEAEPGIPGVTGAVSQSFDEVSERGGASNGQVLMVSNRSVTSAATATYRVEVQQTGQYNLWVAASPNAPLTFRLDNQPVLDEAIAPQMAGASYAGGTLVWTHWGMATLPKGSHTLEIRANGPCAVDAILVTPSGFTPDGPNPPPVKP